MKQYVEKMIKEYPKMLNTRAFLKKQIESYVPVTVDDVIDSMTFSQPDGERVQSNTISDKTGNVALHFRDRINRLNEEVIGEWLKEYSYLDDEITFLEKCIRKLPEDLREVMTYLVLDGCSWDETATCLYVSRKQVALCRREAITILVLQYQKKHSTLAAEIL